MDVMEKHTYPAQRRGFSRNMWLFGGGMALAGAGLAAVLMMNRPEAQTTSSFDPMHQTAATALQPAQTQRAPVQQPAPQRAAPQPVVVAQAESPRPAPRVCASCGVVESVNPVKVKGEGSGAGAVVGGVLGGVVGNQIGGGSGRTAMTVLGAVGGGVAGNEVEKRVRSETAYQVRIRMDDGSLRTMTLAHAPVGRGDRVSVDGSALRPI